MTENDTLKIRVIGSIYGFYGGSYAGKVFDTNGLAPCIRAFGGGNQQPMVIEYESNILRVEDASIHQHSSED